MHEYHFDLYNGEVVVLKINLKNEVIQMNKIVQVCLTHLSLASFLWDIGKQKSHRCDAAECGVTVSHLGLFCMHREIHRKMR